MNAIYLLPVNLYGPRDNFDLETSHVIPALIRKCVEARQSGAARSSVGRRLAHARVPLCEDAAEGLMLAAERYDGAEPVNLGTAEEISIRDLVAKIARLCRFRADRLGYHPAERPAAARPRSSRSRAGVRFSRRHDPGATALLKRCAGTKRAGARHGRLTPP